MTTTGNGDWLSAILSLPPQLQGIVLFGAAVGGGIVIARRYLRRLQKGPTEKVVALNETPTIVEVQQLEALAESVGRLADQVSRLVDVAGEILMDVKLERQAREDEEVRQRYIEEGRKMALEELTKLRPPRQRARRTSNPD